MTQTKPIRDCNTDPMTKEKGAPPFFQKEGLFYKEGQPTPPLVSGEEAFLHARNIATTTSAGDFDFQSINTTRLISGLLQGVSAITPEAHSFELLNGSRWMTSNVEMVKGWNSDKQLLISQNQAFFSSYRFALLNIRLGKATPITLLREPRPTAEETFFITKLDLANDIIELNKGREWTIFSHDHGTLRKFSEHDRIIIGVNTTDSSELQNGMPYILINTASNLYVRADQLLN